MLRPINSSDETIMASALQSLLGQLDLERIETNLFRGISDSLGPPRVFGGQVIGQALIAALNTVEDKPCHSLHGYFLRPGNPSIPIVYEVDRIRDGRSFTTRRVVAVQAGEAIFNMSASFQKMEQGLSHQAKMPNVPDPDEISSDRARLAANLDSLPEDMREMMSRERPIEMKRVEPIDYLNPRKHPPYQHVWVRAGESLPDDTALHQCLLAYASDLGILGTSALPHGKSFLTGLMTASLDHAMWFHRPFRFDEWILFAQDSPAAGGARGFNRGTMFSRDGVLIASVAQEGLIRVVG